MRTISPTATPLPTAYDCVAVYIAGRRTNLVVYGCRPKPTTKKETIEKNVAYPTKSDSALHIFHCLIYNQKTLICINWQQPVL